MLEKCASAKIQEPNRKCYLIESNMNYAIDSAFPAFPEDHKVLIWPEVRASLCTGGRNPGDFLKSTEKQ